MYIFSFSELWDEIFCYCVEFITMSTEEYSPLNETPVNNYLSSLHVQGTKNGIVDEKRGFEITPGQVKVPKTHDVSLWHLFGQQIPPSKMATDTKNRNFDKNCFTVN